MALFTIECFASSRAVISFIEQHHQDLAVVVTTDRYRGRHGGILKQAMTNYRRSGPEFVLYLTYLFVFYFAAVYICRFTARLTKRPRKYFTIAELCRRYGIRHIKTHDVNSADVITELAAAQLDLIVIYFFDQVFRPELIGLPIKGVINVHEAYLPACKGLFPVFFSTIKNDGIFGITVHDVVDISIDAGPILAQKRVAVPKDKSILYLDNFVNQHGVEIVNKVLSDLDAYRVNRVPQTGGSYFSYPTRDDIAEAKRRGFRLTSLREFVAEFC
jgi:methionyl-tRNA formyltransferase